MVAAQLYNFEMESSCKSFLRIGERKESCMAVHQIAN